MNGKPEAMVKLRTPAFAILALLASCVEDGTMPYWSHEHNLRPYILRREGHADAAALHAGLRQSHQVRRAGTSSVGNHPPNRGLLNRPLGPR